MGIYVGNKRYALLVGNTRRKVMTEKALPYDAEVEYLENSVGLVGGYINTLITPTNTMKVEIEFEVLQNDSNISVYGVQDTAAKRFIFDTKVNRAIRFYWGNRAYERKPYAYVNERFVIVQEGKNISVTSNRRNESGSLNSPTWSAINNPICLFTYFQGAPYSKEGSEGVRIYYFKISDNNVYLRDYIPVRVGTTGYMYDKVSGELFGNSGTGNFTLGQDIVPIEYIESTGTQYITTNYVPTVGDSLHVEYLLGSLSEQFQAIYSAGTGNTQMVFIADRRRGSTGAYFRHISQNTSEITYRPVLNTWYSLDVSATGVATIGSATKTSSPTGELDGNNTNLWLLRRRDGTDPFGGRIKNFKIINNGVTKLDLIPVRVGQVGYMYDKVSGQLFSNAGTGSFTLGPDKN